ncbi:MAG: response regulator, partial [Desulfovibrio sp.]
MEILIVDDSPTSRMLLETILKNAGYTQLTSAATAQEALDLLRAWNGLPDLVLMDINMPGMDGIEATRIIKADPKLRDVQIIMVTVSDEEEYLEQAFEAGAVDFINKPVSKVELRARIRSVLRLKNEMDRRKERERELEDLTFRLAEQSNLDCLTSVGNRRCFNGLYAKEWDRARR